MSFIEVEKEVFDEFTKDAYARSTIVTSKPIMIVYMDKDNNIIAQHNLEQSKRSRKTPSIRYEIMQNSDENTDKLITEEETKIEDNTLIPKEG